MKSTYLLIAMLILSFIGVSQSEEISHTSKFRFGFNIATNFSILQSRETIPETVELYNTFGASLGVLMDYTISQKLSILPSAEMSFHNSSVEITYTDQFTYTYEILPISLNLMTHVAYKIGKGENVPYVFIGPNFKIPVSKKPEISTDYYSSHDFAIDFGIGLENKNRFFIFAPELKYSLGLININQNPSIRSLYFHTLSLHLNFK